MPVFRIGDRLHYYAHVPKCGGTAVEGYLTARFGPLGLFEQNRHLVPLDRRWSRTATEHLSVDELQRVIPADWLGDGLYQALSTDYKVAVSFTILIMVLLLRPQGIFGGK